MADDWGFYERRTESEQMRVLVNIGYKGEAPLPEHGDLLSVTVNLYMILRNNRTKQALVSQLERFEAKLEGWLSETFSALYIGRINTVNRLEFYFYCKTDLFDSHRFRKWMEGSWSFRVTEYVKADPEWSFYRYMLPDQLEELYVHNAHMIYALIHKGDDIKQPRNVYHWLLFRKAEDRQEMEQSLQNLGYLIEREKEGEPDTGYPYPLVISRYDNVLLDTVNARVRELYRLISHYDARYDGWGSSMKLSSTNRVKLGYRKLKDAIGLSLKRIRSCRR
ncbi:DUF695 domain-containing protein [Paenibacillus spongiae]|uniref:DUF695 domain-containing protein n=1 Tax=Paenibacillus spongiae TaxID=2909671 RepID=A0ABY5SHQ8_9BACL|nr:DUF695 domain-containing protein [Paenibacillus spongiae]UVI31768.1 DUF695 domain-containing protein [Paenibacillus spongiae]